MSYNNVRRTQTIICQCDNVLVLFGMFRPWFRLTNMHFLSAFLSATLPVMQAFLTLHFLLFSITSPKPPPLSPLVFPLLPFTLLLSSSSGCFIMQISVGSDHLIKLYGASLRVRKHTQTKTHTHTSKHTHWSTHDNCPSHGQTLLVVLWCDDQYSGP